MSKQSLVNKPLASWKTWWESELPASIGASIHKHLDVRKIPGGGRLLTKDTFRADDFKDPYIASVLEGLLTSYPKDKQPSAYLLGDAVLELDMLMNHSLLGHPETNPCKELSRRDDALAEGGKLRKLLSWARTSALKSNVGRNESSTYLKQLANQRVVRVKKSPASSPSTAGSDLEVSSPSSCSSPPLVPALGRPFLGFPILFLAFGGAPTIVWL